MANFNYVNGKIYIQYRVLGKRKSFKTNLKISADNLKKAELIKKGIEEQIEVKNKDIKVKNILQSVGYINGINKDITIEKAVEMYKYKLQLTSKSYQTRFEVALNNFYRIVPKNLKVSKVSYEHSLKLVKLLVDQKLSTITVRTYYDHIKVLFHFLIKSKYLSSSPFTTEVLPKKTKKSIVVFRKDMLDEILSAAKESDTMFYNILSMLLLTGLRPIDLLRIKVGQINFAERRIHLRVSKTNKEFNMPMSQLLFTFISENMRYIMDLDGDQYIFPGYSVPRLGCRFRRLKKRLGIKERFVFSLKTFRRNFATHYAKGLNIQDVSFLLTHDEVETTKAFYADTIVDNIRNKMDSYDEEQNQ